MSAPESRQAAVSEVNPDSWEWKQVERFLLEEIEKHRKGLEQRGVDPVKTEFLRGVITAHRATLALADPKSGEVG